MEKILKEAPGAGHNPAQQRQRLHGSADVFGACSANTAAHTNMQCAAWASDR